MQIEGYARRLRSAQNAAKKQNNIARELAIEVADILKARVKKEGTKIADVAARSGISYPTLLNWVWGEQTHNLPHAEVVKIWRAATARPGQKATYSQKLRRLTIEDWQESNKVLARRIGCGPAQVRLVRRELGFPARPKRRTTK